MNFYNLSTRKVELLKILNKFGSLTSRQISVLFSIDISSVQKHLRGLIEKKLVEKHASRYDNLRFYYATIKGIQTIQSELKTIKSIKWYEIRHTDTIINFIKENKLNLDDFLLEREIDCFIKPARTPDLMIINPTINEIKHKDFRYEITSKTAIEFETTGKSVERYKKIFYTYEYEFCNEIFDQVIFFMTSQIYGRAMKHFSDQSPKIIFKEG